MKTTRSNRHALPAVVNAGAVVYRPPIITLSLMLNKRRIRITRERRAEDN